MNSTTKTASPRVLAVHPNLNRLPANILRAHIVFDRPMQTAEAIEHIKLINDRGIDISNALLDFKDGLWTTDGKILTVLFHPGRVKTGLVGGDRYGSIFTKSEEAPSSCSDLTRRKPPSGRCAFQGGVSLTEGRAYQLVVRDKILGANGKSLESDYYHSFEIAPAIRQGFSAIPDKLLLEENVVRIETNQPLDWLSLQTYLAVTDESDRRLKANFSLTANGKAIVVRMDEFTVKSRRFLRVHPMLEDVAGNRADTLELVEKH